MFEEEIISKIESNRRKNLIYVTYGESGTLK